MVFVGAVRSQAEFCGPVTSLLEVWSGRLRTWLGTNEPKQRHERTEVTMVEWNVGMLMLGQGRDMVVEVYEDLKIPRSRKVQNT